MQEVQVLPVGGLQLGLWAMVVDQHITVRVVEVDTMEVVQDITEEEPVEDLVLRTISQRRLRIPKVSVKGTVL
jgi:hypothetical protein